MTTEELTEYRSKIGASILIIVEPGGSYRLQFAVSNVSDATEGTLKTGEVGIAVEKAQTPIATNESLTKDGIGKSSTTDGKAKIIVDVYGGDQVLVQNNAKYTKIVQALNAIDDVQVNFREAGPGSEIVLAIVRDHNGIMNQEALTTGKPSARRDAIAKALAQVQSVRWEDGAMGVSLQSNRDPIGKLRQ